MYNEENTPKIYKNQYMKNKAIFSQDYANQTYNNLPTEWSPNFTQDQANINLLKTSNKPFMKWSPSFTQIHENQTNNHLSKVWSEDFTQDYENQTNNNLLAECTMDFTQNLSNINLLNIYNNPPIGWFVDFTQDYEDQANHNTFTEWNTSFTHDQTNNAGITQHSEESINTLQQQYNAKSVKENENPTSLVSRHTKRQCKKCNRMKAPYDKNSDQCRDCYGASLQVLSEKGEIKFPENIDVKSSPINEQAIYSSRLLNPLISEALTIRSLKLNFN
ncbi:33888_t:CDS:2, partial [Gigaspora margarita]